MERERKRNQKELASLQHTNASLTRQRDEAQGVVLHLRSLISGQSHHMDHIVRSIGSSTELSELAEKEAAEEVEGEPEVSDTETPRASIARANGNGETKDVNSDMSPELERHLLNLGKGQRQLARLSITDVADRYLRDKTDSIAEIIRGISEQCAAAVEGLHLAQDAEGYESEGTNRANQKADRLAPDSDDQGGQSTRDGSEVGDDNNSLHPDNGTSSVPPTPDLVHNRSSTSMSNFSNSTYPERSSQQYAPGEIPTRIVEDDDEQAHEADGIEAHTEAGTLSKQASEDLMRPNASRLVA